MAVLGRSAGVLSVCKRLRNGSYPGAKRHTRRRNCTAGAGHSSSDECSNGCAFAAAFANQHSGAAWNARRRGAVG